MEATEVALTYEHYAALPSDGRRYEIHEGALSITLTPSPWHQIVSVKLMVALHTHVSARGLGQVLPPLDVILSDTTWMVDRDAHGVECYTLGESGYALTAWLTGDQALNAAPFPDLALPLAPLWA